MKLYFMKQDAVDFMKHNIDRLYNHYFQDKTNEWMTEEYGSNPFSMFMEVPDFELAEIESMSIGEVDFENCKILYNNLRNISESQSSDERLWAGLCNSTFYDYMRRRYQYPTKQLKKKETDISAVISRFFFSGGTRSGFFRNGLAKCWWVGRATFDKDNDNHFAMLDVIGANDLTTKISDIFYSNTFSSNPVILAGICDALKFFSDHGQQLDEKNHIRASMKYLNAIGGATLLDVLSREEICKIVISRITSIMNGHIGDIEIDESDENQLLEEIIDDENYDIEEIQNDNESDKSSLNTSSDIGDTSDYAEEKSTASLNWFEEAEEDILPKPDYITYGCWVKVKEEKTEKIKTYHIPLKGEKKNWFPIMEKLMGQSIGFSFFIKIKYEVVDFGWDE